MKSDGQVAYEAYWRRMTDSPDGAGGEQAWERVPVWAQAAWEAAAMAVIRAGHPDPVRVNAAFDRHAARTTASGTKRQTEDSMWHGQVLLPSLAPEATHGG